VDDDPIATKPCSTTRVRAADKASPKYADFHACDSADGEGCCVTDELRDRDREPSLFAIGRGETSPGGVQEPYQLLRGRFCLLIRTAGLHQEVGDHPFSDFRSDELAAVVGAVGVEIAQLDLGMGSLSQLADVLVGDRSEDEELGWLGFDLDRMFEGCARSGLLIVWVHDVLRHEVDFFGTLCLRTQVKPIPMNRE
jgi:hypothetical protein